MEHNNVGVGGTELFSRIRFAPPLIPLKFIYWKHEKKKVKKVKFRTHYDQKRPYG